MTQPSLTDFLLARLADDEAVARAATGGDRTGNWWIEPDGGGEISCLDVQGFVTAVDVDGDHIARHDPARVLADVEAKRKIVERHRPENAAEDWMDEDWLDTMSDEEKRGYCGWCTYDNRTVWSPCGDLLDLASVYADHPDYRAEEWAP